MANGIPRRVGGVSFREEVVRIREDPLDLDLIQRPRGFSELFVGNIFSRTLTNLVGVVLGKSRLIRATPSAALRVYPDATNHHAVSRGNAADAWSANLWSGLNAIVERVLVRSITNDLEIELTPWQQSADETIVIYAGDPHLEILGLHTVVRVRNETALSTAGYQLIAFYSDVPSLSPAS